ncbi:hypothetical protein RHIZ404_200363 [Rhizobium sp. EC-SD404]|nr:hypothetical protein RHIZ404_200363 [Rhizobium sp. EC-SD404]
MTASAAGMNMHLHILLFQLSMLKGLTLNGRTFICQGSAEAAHGCGRDVPWRRHPGHHQGTS